jgi:hypothetical protein
MGKYFLYGSLGLVVVGGGITYLYFKNQVRLATNYDYKIKTFKYEGLEGDNVKVSAIIVITNRSNFKLTINSFDLELFYEGKKFSDVVSVNPIEIFPNSSFEVKGLGVININDITGGLPKFISNSLQKKPVDIVVSGTVMITFMGVNSKIIFDKQKFNYSTDILAEYGLSDKVESFKLKMPKLANMLKIK